MRLVLVYLLRVDKGNLQQAFTYNGKLQRAAVKPLLPVRQIPLRSGQTRNAASPAALAKGLSASGRGERWLTSLAAAERSKACTAALGRLPVDVRHSALMSPTSFFATNQPLEDALSRSQTRILVLYCRLGRKGDVHSKTLPLRAACEKRPFAGTYLYFNWLLIFCCHHDLLKLHPMLNNKNLS